MVKLSLVIVVAAAVTQAKEIDKPQDLQQEETAVQPGFYGPPDDQQHLTAAAADPEENAAAWPLGRPDMPQIKSLNVKCEKNHMKVFLEFDRPFHGMIFSKGHYSDPKCVHLPPSSGHIAVNFDIFLGSCGMTSSQSGAGDHGEAGGLYIEDTVIVQYDPQVQEIWDQARRLRCTWYDFYEKAVTFRPFNVDMLDAVTANFLGDNIQCWMQIQVGKGPWASEVAGIVKIGQTMTMVLAIKDDENKFDMLVRNCVAHDGKHQPISLVDEQGCVARPKIMSRFQKIKNFGSSASVVSYAYFQAFKFPDSMNVHFQCVIQVCRYECPEPKCPNDHLLAAPHAGQFDDSNHVSASAPAPSTALGGVPAHGRADHHLGAYSENRPVYVPAATAGSGGSGGGGGGSANHVDAVAGDTDGDDQDDRDDDDDDDDVESDGNGGGGDDDAVDDRDNEAREMTRGSNAVGGHVTHIERRVDTVTGGTTAAAAGHAGRPRAMRQRRDVVSREGEDNSSSSSSSNRSGSRSNTRRGVSSSEEVETRRVIQVVAPGDVAFSLGQELANQTATVYSSPLAGDRLCVPLAGFTVALVSLLVLLVVSSLVAGFLFVRVRHVAAGAWPTPDFVKVVR